MTKNNILGDVGVFPNYRFEVTFDAKSKEYFAYYCTWIPVDEGYHIFFEREYHLDRNTKEGSSGEACFKMFLKHVSFLMNSYNPAEYYVVNKYVLKHKGMKAQDSPGC